MSTGKTRAPRFRAGDRVRLLFGREKVAGEILEDRGPLGEYGRRLYRVRINVGRDDESSFEVPEEDLERRDQNAVEDESPGLRQEFSVTYVRRDKSNRWSATTKAGQLFRGIKAKGAVGYSTAGYEGERDDDERFAIVSVLVECDPRVSNSQSRVRPTALQEMAGEARELADTRFRTRHPDALIDHEPSIN
jgi:hypothetical protein